ncbi:MAG: ComF family protein, partial [Patescibacteria group bacterium]|nr:ComF family protein [Patescibacteria group bacterium]
DFNFQQKMYFDKAYSLYFFTEKSLLLIHLFKYDHKKSLGERIGIEMGHYISSVSNLRDVDMLVPIPLHPVRKRERGYNQSEVLAGYASIQCNIPMVKSLIIRTVNNPSQTGLNLEERKRNIEGIFELSDAQIIKEKRILIIDDVMTSGVTMNECAKQLKKAGASEVFCFAVIHPERL